MPPKPRPQFVQPREAATGDFQGEPFVVNPADIFAAEHPLVREYPHLFKPVDASRARPAVEQMTATPGEVRA